MIRVHIVAEGPTETNFVKNMLGPYFSCYGITLIPYTVITRDDKKAGRQYKGGISHYSKVKNDIIKCLVYTKKPNVYVSTFFDFYHLPDDFPGYTNAQKIENPYLKVEFLEKSLQDDVCRDSISFLPYLSLHEFEALLFSDVSVIEKHFFDKDIAPLMTVASQYSNPELINNGQETSPSKRILECVPEYTKPTDGVMIARKIGLDVLRARCSHFDAWIKKLENLKSSGQRYP
jgi:hypothetical protein